MDRVSTAVPTRRRWNWDGHWSWLTDRRVVQLGGPRLPRQAPGCMHGLVHSGKRVSFRSLLQTFLIDVSCSLLLAHVNLASCRPVSSICCRATPGPRALSLFLVATSQALTPPGQSFSPSRPTPRTGTDLAATLRPRSDCHPRRLSYASHPFTPHTPSLYTVTTRHAVAIEALFVITGEPPQPLGPLRLHKTLSLVAAAASAPRHIPRHRSPAVPRRPYSPGLSSASTDRRRLSVSFC